MIQFNLNLSDKIIDYDKHWEFGVGSCHAALALREDYRRQLVEVQRQLGFKYLRFHGLFDDDMSVLSRSLFSSEYLLSFVNIDNIYDFLLSVGMKPFVEIGFMPECLKSGNETIFHYKANITPPRDKALWVWFIKEFIKHLIDRYGREEVRTWYFEIWNEPNLDGENGLAGGRFWSGNMNDYYELYRITSTAIKEIDSTLRVGGPATSNNAHIPDMLRFCRENGLPLDFVSTHHYPTDVVLGYGVEDSQNFVKEFNSTDRNDLDKIHEILKHDMTFQADIWEKVDRGVLTQMAKRAKQEAEGLPLYYTEWSSLAGLETDGAFGASFIAKTVLDNIGIVDGCSYWTFSDIVEEKSMASVEFHGGFGLTTLHGVKKAPYRAFELLHALPERKYERNLSEGTVDCYVFPDDRDNTLKIIAVNHNSLMHKIETEEISLTFSANAVKMLNEGTIVRIDQRHANALEKWREAGTPVYLTEAQLYELKAASELRREALPVASKDGTITVRFELPPQGMALITLYKTA